MNNDLISRSALLEAMRKESILHRQAFHIDTKALIQHEEEFSACMRVVCSAPTVDAEVVRHGRWIPYFEPMECFVDVYLNTEIRDVHMGWICSECGRYEQHGTTEEMPYKCKGYSIKCAKMEVM